jgi:AcrR family transcriptional regulator
MLTGVGRRRVHDQDTILDAAEELLAEDAARLTIRSLANRTGAPSGSLYHAFGSRAGLLATMWLRGARLFLRLQQEAVEQALAGPGTPAANAVAATIAAANTLADLGKTRPNTAALLTSQRRERLLEEDLPAGLASALRDLDRELLAVLHTLAQALWGRIDRLAIETVAACVVDLPSALLPRRRPRQIDPRPLLAAAISGILASEPPVDDQPKTRRTRPPAAHSRRRTRPDAPR